MADLSPCEPLTPTNAAPVGQDQPTRPRSSEELRARSGRSGCSALSAADVRMSAEQRLIRLAAITRSLLNNLSACPRD